MNKKRKCDKNTLQYSKHSHTNLQGNWSTGFSVYRGWMDRHIHRQTDVIELYIRYYCNAHCLRCTDTQKTVHFLRLKLCYLRYTFKADH